MTLKREDKGQSTTYSGTSDCMEELLAGFLHASPSAASAKARHNEITRAVRVTHLESLVVVNWTKYGLVPGVRISELILKDATWRIASESFTRTDIHKGCTSYTDGTRPNPAEYIQRGA